MPDEVNMPVKPHAGIRAAKMTTRAKWNSYIWSYIYLAPMLILLAVFVVYPLFMSFKYTLYEWDGIGNPKDYVGLRQFVEVARDQFFWKAFMHTWYYTLILVPIQLFLTLVLALVLNNKNLTGATVYRTVFFLPVVTIPAVVAIVWSLIIGTFGDTVRQIMGFSQPIDFLGDPRYNLNVIIIFGIWYSFGWNLIFFLAGLQSVPKDLYEAATVDGAGAVAQFWHVTVPVLKPVGLIILFLAVIGSMKVFDQVWVMTGGGPYYASEVVQTYIYKKAFSATETQNIGFASAAAVFQSFIIFLIASLQFFAFRAAGKARAQNKL
ncbi:MAG: carbohydrate ABC transporter permease [Bacillota bacterium]